jgi:hypothetical protein
MNALTVGASMRGQMSLLKIMKGRKLCVLVVGEEPSYKRWRLLEKSAEGSRKSERNQCLVRTDDLERQKRGCAAPMGSDQGRLS